MCLLWIVQPFEVDDIVAYGPWIGRVQDNKARVILKLTNGSRYVLYHIQYNALKFLETQLFVALYIVISICNT